MALNPYANAADEFPQQVLDLRAWISGTPLQDSERATIASLRKQALVGTADQVAFRLRELAQRLALDELVIVTGTHDPAPRLRSYELLADAFQLRRTHARVRT